MCGVVFGTGAIPSFDNGQYFEVKVESAKSGHGDGLAIGFTTLDPHTLTETYEVANMVQDSWTLGYDGQVQIDGETDMRDIKWQPKLLKAGDRVGLLVRPDGIAVLQNGVQVDEVLCGNIPAGKALYPVIDLIGGTNAVSLILGASPPVPGAATPTAVDPNDSPREYVKNTAIEARMQVSDIDTNTGSDTNSGTEDTDEDTDAFELHDLVIDNFLDDRIGLRLDKDSLKVTYINEPDARSSWCVGDQIKAVQNVNVTNYEDLLSMFSERRNDTPITVTVMRNKEVGSNMARRASLGMLGGVVGGAAFGLTCVAAAGGGAIAAATLGSYMAATGGLSGSAYGVNRQDDKTSLFGGLLAGYVGPWVTAAYVGGELAVNASVHSSDVDV
jgi:hypothetical protein